MNIQHIPRNADLIVAIKELISDAQLQRLKHDFEQHFSGHRAIFIRGGEMEITPIVRRARKKYTPSLVGHVK